MRTPASVFAGLALVSLTATLPAQVVAGRVVASTSGEVLPGTAVVLVDDSARVVQRGRTDAAGVFAVQAPSAGRYLVVLFTSDGSSFASPPIELAPGDYLEREFAVAEIPAALREIFFDADVDRPAVPRPRNPVPRYPQSFRDRGERGVVSTMFVVDSAGRVDMSTFQAIGRTPHAFVDAVRAVLPRWEFEPAVRQGVPVRQVVQLSFDFGIADDPPVGDIVIRALGIYRRRVIGTPDPGAPPAM